MPGPSPHRSTLAFWAVSCIALLAATIHAWTLFWTCDDAFITFRYADNLVAGKGLVYNAVERVEGYSNFLWTILIALARALTNIDVAVLGNWLGLAFFVGTLLLLVRATRKLGGANALPIAAVGLACHYHFRVFASCGLETSMIAFLITALVCNLIEAKGPRCYLVAGVIGSLVAMTRADGPFVYGLAGLFVLFESIQKRNPRLFLAILLPGLLIWVPYFISRWVYYGDPMANVFYAKSVNKAYPSQGLVYVWMFFKCYWILIPGLVGIGLLALRRGPCQRAAAAIAAVALPFVLFIVWVGGDFMFARYLIPITPLLYLALEVLARSAYGVRYAPMALGVVAGGSLLMLYPEQITKHPAPRGIGEERTIYTQAWLEHSRAYGGVLRRMTEGTDASMAILGGQAGIAYYSRFPLVIECANGLTDRRIARQHIETRGMPGHERRVGKEYLFERGVNFALFPPKIVGFDHPYDEKLRSVRAGKEVITIICWSDEVMRQLTERSRGAVQFVDVRAHLDEYLGKVGTLPKAQVRADLAYFRDFYFDHNDDPERLARFEAAAR